MMERVSTDQEIGGNACPASTPPPITFPGLASDESSFQSQSTELNPKALHGLTSGLLTGEKARDLGPDHFAGNQATLTDGTPKGLFGADTKGRIRAKNIEEDIGINGGYHARLFPRRRATTASVEPPRRRMPKHSSTGSLVSAFATTRRPRSSSTSNRWPARIPNRIRSALGIVIWPFSET